RWHARQVAHALRIFPCRHPPSSSPLWRGPPSETGTGVHGTLHFHRSQPHPPSSSGLSRGPPSERGTGVHGTLQLSPTLRHPRPCGEDPVQKGALERMAPPPAL